MGLRRRSGTAAATGEHPLGSRTAGRQRAPLTRGRAKRLVGVGTVVAPMLAPYALAAAGAARAAWDARRAAALGVEADQLSAYSGRGGALHARISRIATTLTELDSDAEVHATGAARRFAVDTRPRLADLSVAVRAAELMPTARRRAAHRAIGGELDRIEATLLTHLGITT